MKPSDEDLAKMKETWDSSTRDAIAANEGSAQDFTEASGKDAKENS